MLHSDWLMKGPRMMLSPAQRMQKNCSFFKTKTDENLQFNFFCNFMVIFHQI